MLTLHDILMLALIKMTNHLDIIHHLSLINNMMFWRLESVRIIELVDWAQDSRSYLMTETDSSLQKVLV
jgi:hypothetical protein